MKELTIEDLRSKRELLENSLMSCIQSFEKETSVQVTEVVINFEGSNETIISENAEIVRTLAVIILV